MENANEHAPSASFFKREAGIENRNVSIYQFPSLGTENTRAEVGNANEHTKANKEKINA